MSDNELHSNAAKGQRCRDLVFAAAKTLQDGQANDPSRYDIHAETWADLADDLDRAAILAKDIAESLYRFENREAK